MRTRNYRQMFLARQRTGRHACVGLDADDQKIPSFLFAKYENSIEEVLFHFCAMIIDATWSFVGAYKPNLAFFLAHGDAGQRALKRVVAYIHKIDPSIPVILDAKWQDIDNTNKKYVQTLRDLDVDAVTLHSYLGTIKALDVFLAEADIECIVLCRTSNEGAREYQDQTMVVPIAEVEGYLGAKHAAIAKELGWTRNWYEKIDYDDGIEGYKPIQSYFIPYYQLVAMRISKLQEKYGNLSLVVGATYASDIAVIRKLVRDEVFLLIPGAGKGQNGDAKACAFHAANSEGIGFVINSSRGILEAGNDEHLGVASAAELAKLNDQIAAGIAEQMLLRANAVIKNDHFVYQAGDHGSEYVNKDAVFLDPLCTEAIAVQIGLRLAREGLDVLVAPVVGASKILQSVAMTYFRITGKKLKVVHADKQGEGADEAFIIRRGYEKEIPGRLVALIEDIFTTGGTVAKVSTEIRRLDGEVAIIAGIVNRGDVTAESLGVPTLSALVNVSMAKQPAKDCELCKKGMPVNTSLGHGAAFLKEQAARTEAAAMQTAADHYPGNCPECSQPLQTIATTEYSRCPECGWTDDPIAIASMK